MLGVLETVDLEDVLKSVLNSHGQQSAILPGTILMLVSYVLSLDSLAMVLYLIIIFVVTTCMYTYIMYNTYRGSFYFWILH